MKTTLTLAISFLVALSSLSQNKLNLPALNRIKGITPRNVIFILTDDHRFDFMGFTGKLPWLRTPNMDYLFEHGAWFKNAYVTTALCSPSRASILTGAYSHVHRIAQVTELRCECYHLSIQAWRIRVSGV